MPQSNQRLELTWFNKSRALIPAEQGKYGYKWVDPADPRYCETHTLVTDGYVSAEQHGKTPDVEYSERADFAPTTDNLLVRGESGDLLEALTRVPELADQYVGRVKCIYCDPPFNTEKTFEHYEDNLEHSIWLTMMRDRLQNMRKLLAPDGSIWMHLDDVENHRMRVLLDEIFGPHNFVAELAVEINPKGRQLGDGLARSHDSMLVYSKTPNVALHTGDAGGVNLKDYPHALEDGTPFRYLPLRNSNKKFNPKTSHTMYFPLYANEETGKVATAPFDGSVEVYPVFGDGSPAVWRWSRPKIDAQNDELCARIVDGQLGERLDVAQIDTAGEDKTKKFKTVWLSKEIGSSDSAKVEIEKLFPDRPVFSTPKPEKLLERVIHIATDPGDIVLDVFGGSGTTAAVAHKMGRRWVTGELLSDTFTEFTLPRLEKVVRGEDPGGVTTTGRARVAVSEEGLPDGLDPDDAAKLTSLLNKALRHSPEWKDDPTIRALKEAVKTHRPDRVHWRGGGGFQIAHLSAACFDYDDELGAVTLTDDAHGENLINAIAAHLGYRLTQNHPVFTASKGSSRLVVTRTPLTAEMVLEFADLLEADERITIAATSVVDGARQALREASPGSRVVHVPDDLFASAQKGEGQ